MRLAQVPGQIGLLVLIAMTGVVLVQLEHRAVRSLPAPAALPPLPANAAAPAPASLDAAATTRVNIFCDRLQRPAALVSGWSDPEPGSGIWSDATAATVQLPAPPAGAAAELAITLEPYLAPGLSAQTLRLTAGGRTLAAWRLTRPGPQTLHTAIPADLPSPDGRLEVRFELPDAAAPAHLTRGAHDQRKLGVKLKKLQLTL